MASVDPSTSKASSRVRRIVCKWQKKLRRSDRSYASLDSISSLSTTGSDLEERAAEEGGTTMVIHVGKDKRKFIVQARHLKHPLFKSLIRRSNTSAESVDETASAGADDPADDLLIVSCEVVMFEHLLWMLESYDPAELHAEAIDELLDLYTTN